MVYDDRVIIHDRVNKACVLVECGDLEMKMWMRMMTKQVKDSEKVTEIKITFDDGRHLWVAMVLVMREGKFVGLQKRGYT